MSQHLIREVQQLKYDMQQIKEGWAEAHGDAGDDIQGNLTNVWKLLNDINTRVQRLENIVSSNDPDETVFIEPDAN